MGGKVLQQYYSNPTQDSAGILQRKMMGNFDASYAHVVANKMKNNQKVVAASILSLTSDEEIDEECVFCCGSCPRKFSSQQAMAGHRNTHRSEWEPIELQEIRDHDKMERKELQCYLEQDPLPNLTIELKRQSSGVVQHPLAKPTSVLKGSSVCVPKYPLANRGDTLKGQSTCVPRYSMVKANPTIAHKEPTPGYLLAKAKAKANPTMALKGPTTGYPLAKANLTTSLKRPTTGYPLVKANPTIALKGLAPGYPLTMANPTMALKGPALGYPLDKANPINAFKWSSPTPRFHMVKAIPTNTLKKVSPRHPLGNPTNTPIEPTIASPWYILAKATNSLIGPSLGVAHYTFVPLKNTLNMPLVCQQNHPLEKCAKTHGNKSTLGVRCESMIRKPCQGKLGQNDTRLRAGLTSFGRQQMIGGKIKHFGINNNNVGLKSLSTSAGSTSTSASKGRGSGEVHDLLSSSFQPVNGKGKKAEGCFAPTSTQERQNHDVDNSSQGLVMQWDKNGENDSFLDVDLDLKL